MPQDDTRKETDLFRMWGIRQLQGLHPSLSEVILAVQTAPIKIEKAVSKGHGDKTVDTVIHLSQTLQIGGQEVELHGAFSRTGETSKMLRDAFGVRLPTTETQT